MRSSRTCPEQDRGSSIENRSYLSNGGSHCLPGQSPAWQQNGLRDSDGPSQAQHAQQQHEEQARHRKAHLSDRRPSLAARDRMTEHCQRLKAREQALKQEAERARQAVNAGHSTQEVSNLLQRTQMFASRQHSCQREPSGEAMSGGSVVSAPCSPGRSSSFNMPGIPGIPGIPAVPGLPGVHSRGPSPLQGSFRGSFDGSHWTPGTNPFSQAGPQGLSGSRGLQNMVSEETWGAFHERRVRSGTGAAQDGSPYREVWHQESEKPRQQSSQSARSQASDGMADGQATERLSSFSHDQSNAPAEPMQSPFAGSLQSGSLPDLRAASQPAAKFNHRSANGPSEDGQSSPQRRAGPPPEFSARPDDQGSQGASSCGQHGQQGQGSQKRDQHQGQSQRPQYVGMLVQCEPGGQAESTVQPPGSRPSWQEPRDSVQVPKTPAPAAPLTACLSGTSSMDPPDPEITSSIPELRDDEWEINPEEVVKEKDSSGKDRSIGSGTYGCVYKAKWRHTEVALKELLTTQDDLSPRLIHEFREEVAIMRRLKHPNILLFMGACTKPPKLSIVTQYVPRGSLFHLLHRRHDVVLDQKRCVRMGLDVARGMHYLHSCRPPIVHRDLKSPNLLVDKDFTIKVCDFGLSRVRYATLVNSRLAGTPAWTAPEVLRSEGYNEKSDVFSFGVVLWELATRQEPWSECYDPVQIVGAVGFGGRTLEMPEDRSHPLIHFIERCFTEPKLRPSFCELCAELTALANA